MIQNNHIKRFNCSAQEYATDRYPGRAQCMQKVLELLDPQINDIVLDVGCGPGIQLIALSPLIKCGYGIDPAEQMIQRAEQEAVHCQNMQFYVGSAEHIPDKIRHVGVNKIYSNYALHHLSEKAKQHSIQNLASLLPEGGTVIIGDLMFSDNPDQHQALFDMVGYGPGCDTPSRLSIIENIFKEAGLSYQTIVLNPLVAVIVGRNVKYL